jgi:catechol 2,3-dioxygenase-like lactoylglutathione lyase family enzyme
MGTRYIVEDTEREARFYAEQLGFEIQRQPGPGFAILTRGGLRLMLNDPSAGGGASEPSTDGRRPVPGGWNRIQLEVADLDAEIARLRDAEVRFRTGLATGRGGRQILVEDPSGNPVELLERTG